MILRAKKNWRKCWVRDERWWMSSTGILRWKKPQTNVPHLLFYFHDILLHFAMLFLLISFFILINFFFHFCVQFFVVVVVNYMFLCFNNNKLRVFIMLRFFVVVDNSVVWYSQLCCKWKHYASKGMILGRMSRNSIH